LLLTACQILELSEFAAHTTRTANLKLGFGGDVASAYLAFEAIHPYL
jgi:hypothetical protein